MKANTKNFVMKSNLPPNETVARCVSLFWMIVAFSKCL